MTVAIMGVLGALLFPAVNKAIVKAQSAKCMGNLKQFGAAFQAHASDFDGAIPASASKASGSENLYGNWFDDISPYMIETQKMVLSQWKAKLIPMISCPTFKSKYLGKPDINTGWIGYGMNTRLRLTVGDTEKTDKPRMKLSAIPNPGRTVLMGDSGGMNLDIGPNGYQFVRDATQFEGWKLGGTPDRHETTSNYLFVDGHVEALAPQAAVEALKPRQL